jgi:lactate dehydrogenase-like 2-hydroxyacid dehydrogenase
MDILYHNRTARADVDYGYYASPLELAEAADHLVLSCPGGEGTRHLVNQDVLAALGPAGVLVNVARGSVVDTAALVGALQSGAIGGAGLDIIEGDGAALTHMDNVVMTPHLAGNTLEAGAAKDALTLAILIDFFAGREIMNRVV